MPSTPNRIELIGTYGDDEIIAAAAWTSTGGLTPERRARVPALLADLAKNGHMTPFERGFLHFHVVAETATAIHLMKHRTIQMNGESARYREIKDDRFYVPSDWPQDLADVYVAQMERDLSDYHAMLDALVARGFLRSRAKESARFLRPYGAQTSMDISMSFRAFMDFLRLRLSPHAQLEIRTLAASALDQVRQAGMFNHAIGAFGYIR